MSYNIEAKYSNPISVVKLLLEASSWRFFHKQFRIAIASKSNINIQTKQRAVPLKKEDAKVQDFQGRIHKGNL